MLRGSRSPAESLRFKRHRTTGATSVTKRGLRTAALACILMFAALAVLFAEDVTIASASATLAVDPKVGGKAPGELYSVDIVILDVSKLVLWEFNLTFNTAVLEVESVTEGPFLEQAGSTMMPKPVLNNTAGFALATCSLFSMSGPGASGDGVLATVVFRVKAEGTSPLHFSELDKRWPYMWDGSTLVSIAYVAVDGAFTYPVEVAHDVTVEDIAVSSLAVVSGETVSVNVTLLNQGNATESFDVTLYYDSMVIGTQTVSNLLADRSKTLTFEWRTAHVAAGDYVLTAVADIVDGETTTLDNSFSFAAITVTDPPPAFPIELSGLTVAIAALVFIDVILFRKRSRSKTELQHSAEEKKTPT